MKQDPTENSSIQVRMLGFCQFAPADLNKHDACPGLIQRFYHGTVKRGRKKEESVIYLDEYSKCSCLCHIPEEDRPKPKRRRAAKKTTTKRKK